ncbi:MAG: threonylcarbamoyl-AMP synthase [Candidatus Westeberhardia cardiocondylae]|nr:threonylcarbamoyl-AMP synthase [Candidatus Westeberhardia cardiocondylae]
MDILINLVRELKNNNVIAYPSESVFSLGCDPDSIIAVRKLLNLKKRSWRKGLILVADCYEQFRNYVDDSKLSTNILSWVFSFWPGHVTFLFPALSTVPWWIVGDNNSVAIRVSAFQPIKKLSLMFGKPLVSTSANVTGKFPAKTAYEVSKFLGNSCLIMNESIGGRLFPSRIFDVVTGEIIR